MEEHAKQDQPGNSRAPAKRRQQRQCPWHVQHPHAHTLFRLRAAKVAHCRGGIEATLMNAVPRQMVHIYQHARGPRDERLASQNRQQQARAHG